MTLNRPAASPCDAADVTTFQPKSRRSTDVCATDLISGDVDAFGGAAFDWLAAFNVHRERRASDVLVVEFNRQHVVT